MNKFIWIFTFLFVYKLISNLIDLINIKRFYNMYNNYLREDIKDKRILNHRSHTIALFKKAGIEDVSIPASQEIGYNRVADFNASSFCNFPSKIDKLVISATRMFEDAIGIYKSRILECFNPLYWINCVIFLPKILLSYLGLSAESIFTKLLQVFYWIVSIIFTLFSSEIITWIKSLI